MEDFPSTTYRHVVDRLRVIDIPLPVDVFPITVRLLVIDELFIVERTFCPPENFLSSKSVE
jgi:hypothetical protein